MSTFDVAVIGAGPAGAWASYRLSRGGARVALIDGSHPREKPCGGGITGRTLEVVRRGIPSARVSAVRIRDATFSHDSQEARTVLPADVGGLPALCVASRREFDGMLLTAAREAGAELIASRAVAIDRVDCGWAVQTRAGRLNGAWLLGADGANSLVRRRVGQPFQRPDLSIATGFFVRQCMSTDIAIAFEDSPAGYIWSFPRPDHLAMGICGQADECTSQMLQARASAWITRHIGRLTDVERYGWPIPSLRACSVSRERPAGDRWMLVGDAGGLVDPITREGIYFAVRSGDLAAESLLNATNPAANYSGAIRREIHPELIRAARVKSHFYQPHFMGLLINALQRSHRIRDVMSDLIAGRQPYRGLRRRLFATFELGLMVELLWQRTGTRITGEERRTEQQENGRRGE